VVERYHKRWNEYPNYAAEGAYSTLYLLKYAIEKANDLLGAWPEPSQIISMLEGMVMATPAAALAFHSADRQIVGFQGTDARRSAEGAASALARTVRRMLKWHSQQMYR
jgi:ABC-type branched-subunit amino acid transport system substrate-binding protein